jgi:hypothetical protein
MQYRRVSITPEGAHELRVYPRVAFEMIGDAGAILDFAEEMAERRRAEPMQMFDEALTPKAWHRFCVQLRHAAPNGMLSSKAAAPPWVFALRSIGGWRRAST